MNLNNKDNEQLLKEEKLCILMESAKPENMIAKQEDVILKIPITYIKDLWII